MDNFITLDYGSGGKKTSALISDMILPLLKNEALEELGDGAVIDGAEKLVYSTDSFVVSPYFFPGGDIGKLSVCGTVNDISMAGGEPKFLSLGLIIEEGLPVADLQRIIDSIRAAGANANVLQAKFRQRQTTRRAVCFNHVDWIQELERFRSVCSFSTTRVLNGILITRTRRKTS